MKISLSTVLILILTVGLTVGPTAFAAEKLKVGTVVKASPVYYLPMLAAEEKGFWKQNGLEVEWIPFASSIPMYHGIAARSLFVGLSPGVIHVQTVAAGSPTIMVGEVVSGRPDFIVWVRADSPIKEPKDLKGAKIGVPATGGLSHFMARVVVKGLGMEKDVKIVGAGGIPQELAALKAGAIEAVTEPLRVMLALKLAGEVREVVPVGDFLPRDWVDTVVVARSDFVKSNLETLRKVMRAMVQTTNFLRSDMRWTMDKMKAEQKFSEEGARLVYGTMDFAKTGIMNRKGLENIRSFLIEFGMVAPEKVPPVDELFTREVSG